MWQSEVKSSRVGMSAPKIENYEMLAQVEGFIAKSILSKFDREPHPLTDLWTKDDFLERVKINRSLKKLYDDMQSFYTGAFEEGLRIEPDKFGGFGLFNRSSRRIPPGEIPFSVGLLEKCPRDRIIDDWSAVQGEKILAGVARWANHSCIPNCDFYMSGGYRGRQCVRLRALRDIYPGEERLVFYSSSRFGAGNKHCLCGNNSKHQSLETSVSQIVRETSTSQIDESSTIQYVEEISASQDIESSSTAQFIEQNSAIQVVEETTVGLNFSNSLTFAEASTSQCLDSSGLRIRSKNRKDKKSVSQENTITQLLIFYSELSNISFDSLDQEIAQIEGEESPNNVTSVDVQDSEDDLEFFSEEVNEDGSFEGSGSPLNLTSEDSIFETAVFNQGSKLAFELDDVRITSIPEVTAGNLAASLLTIVTKHNGSDALLQDLLKRDQQIFSGQTVSGVRVKAKVQEACLSYQKNGKISENGELILVDFFGLLKKLIVKNLSLIIDYAEVQKKDESILMPKLSLDNNELIIRLILNSDGAVVSKSPSTSAWPVLIAIADLPPSSDSYLKT